MTENQNTTFDPHALKANISRAGLTIKQICIVAGVRQATVSGWVRGAKPQEAVLKKFMDAFAQLKEEYERSSKSR